MLEDEKIIEDLRKLSLNEVGEKYNLTFKELFELTRKYNNRINVKVTKDSYISKTKNRKWAIRKSINGKMCYFGTYNVKRDATIVVQELIKVDWNEDCLESILEKLGIERCRKD